MKHIASLKLTLILLACKKLPYGTNFGIVDNGIEPCFFKLLTNDYMYSRNVRFSIRNYKLLG